MYKIYLIYKDIRTFTRMPSLVNAHAMYATLFGKLLKLFYALHFALQDYIDY